MPTDTSEKGLEARTVNLLQDSGWLPRDSQDYNAASCVDLAAFLHDTSRRPTKPCSGGCEHHQNIFYNDENSRTALRNKHLAMDMGPGEGPRKYPEARYQLRYRPTGIPRLPQGHRRGPTSRRATVEDYRVHRTLCHNSRPHLARGTPGENHQRTEGHQTRETHLRGRQWSN